jgi:aminoglycoside phosphotransferase family enzyme
MVGAATGANDPGLAAKVAFLSRPESYPGPPSAIDPRETHMSWVFLRERDVYKLKKPARLPRLDFTTCAQRERFCREELRLNRRLSDDVYLDVVPLAQDADGRLRLGAGGATVDWLVHMRRLSDERMLDQMISSGTLREGDLQRVATRLSRFYGECAAVPMTPDEYCARFDGGIAEYEHELARADHGLPRANVTELCARQRNARARLATLLAARAARVVDAHGDLRPEHICLEPAPQIIDCLEFAHDLRLAEPADELAFLALECERLGAAWAAAPLFATYAEVTGDRPAAGLVAFYQSYRACVRAMIAIRHLDDDDVRPRTSWVERALHYLQLARAKVELAAPL